MDFVYVVVDVIIFRVGVLLVLELCIVGKLVIFILLFNVVEDYQIKNVQVIVDVKGVILLKEIELESQFSIVFEVLLKDEGK